MWESCWANYLTDYFHLFLCLAIVSVYADDVIAQNLRSDEMLLHFSSLGRQFLDRKFLSIFSISIICPICGMFFNYIKSNFIFSYVYGRSIDSEKSKRSPSSVQANEGNTMYPFRIVYEVWPWHMGQFPQPSSILRGARPTRFLQQLYKLRRQLVNKEKSLEMDRNS